MASAADVRLVSVRSCPFSELLSESWCTCMAGGSCKPCNGWSFSFDGLCWNWGKRTFWPALFVSLRTEQSFSESKFMGLLVVLVLLPPTPGSVWIGELVIFFWVKRLKSFNFLIFWLFLWIHHTLCFHDNSFVGFVYICCLIVALPGTMINNYDWLICPVFISSYAAFPFESHM